MAHDVVSYLSSKPARAAVSTKGMVALFSVLALASYVFAGQAFAQTSLTVNLGWQTYIPYVAPMLVAEKLGYFKDGHLSVNLHNGTGSAGAVQMVAAGHDDLAWVDLTTAATAIGEGNPVLAVANIQPKGELGLISLKSANITSPQDVVGKSIGSDPSGSDPVLLKLFLNANNISPAQVKIQNVPGNSRIPLLLSQKIDLISGQGFHYQTLLTAQHQESNFLLYGNFGANAIGHGFVANRDRVSSQGLAIKAFLAAYAKGLQYTRDHINESCQTFLDTQVIGFTLDMCKEELNGWLPLLSMPETQGKPFRWSSDQLWKRTVDSLQKYGGTPEKALTDYYTNEYLPNL